MIGYHPAAAYSNNDHTLFYNIFCMSLSYFLITNFTNNMTLIFHNQYPNHINEKHLS